MVAEDVLLLKIVDSENWKGFFPTLLLLDNIEANGFILEYAKNPVEDPFKREVDECQGLLI